MMSIFFSENNCRTTGDRYFIKLLTKKVAIIRWIPAFAGKTGCEMYSVNREFKVILLIKTFLTKCLAPQKDYILGLWLHQGRRANRLFISQESFRKCGVFFRQRFAFVLDLPIRLMKFSCNRSDLLKTFVFSLSMNHKSLARIKTRVCPLEFSLTMKRVEFIFLSLVLSLFIFLGIWHVPVQAQTQNGFTAPVEGDVLSGIVIVEGTAADSSFLRYELAFRHETGPNSDWIVFAQGDQPVINGTLAVWDTTVGSSTNRVFPDGRYQLRLRVVRQDFNYDEYFVSNLTIANDSGTPTPTPTLTTTVESEAATPEGAETALPQLTQPAPDVLPSLTPFPTPSPQATPVNEPLGPGSDGGQDTTEERQGVFEQISGIDTGLFGSAFWQGVKFVAAIFGLLAAYLLLRGVFRRLWRIVSNRLLR
jgi:hypothetical protein